MTYDALETSGSDGYVIELYEFNGVVHDYYYTSFAEAHSHGGHDYVPLAGLKRKGITTTTVGGSSSGDLEIELPYDSDLAAEYAFTDVPADLSLTLRRKHLSDPDEAAVVIWSGKVGVWTVKGRMASFKVPSVFTLALDNIIPRVRWQKPCNHLLYDGRCGLDRELHKFVSNCVAYSLNTIELSSMAWTSNEGVGGEAIDAATGERRTIVSHTGTVITLKLPFSRSPVGHNIRLYKGCDHTGETCQSKFSNIANFGGFLLIPPVNPFGSTIR